MTGSLPRSRTHITQLIGAVLRTAAEHHRAGRRADAGLLYREVLEMDARNADALFLLGVLAREDGRLEEAQRLLAEAGRWAASRTQIDAERRVVDRLLALPPRKPAGAVHLSQPQDRQCWVSRVMSAGDGFALAAIARA